MLRPNAGYCLLILEVSRSHTTTHHIRYDSSGRVISSSQRRLPDNIQHSQQTNIYSPGGIRTHNLSRRAAADLRLRPRAHWDRPISYPISCWICINNSGRCREGDSEWMKGAKPLRIPWKYCLCCSAATVCQRSARYFAETERKAEACVSSQRKPAAGGVVVQRWRPGTTFQKN